MSFSPPSFDRLTQEEMERYAHTLNEVIETLKNEPLSLEIIEKGIKNSKMFLQVVKIARLNFLETLIEKIIHYFQNIQHGMSFSKEHQEIFSKIAEELNQLAHQESLPKNIPPYEDFETQLTVLHQVSNEDKKVSLKEKAASFLDATMYELFANELDLYSKTLDQKLIELEKNTQEESILESLMRSAHSIKGAARVVNFNEIVQLAHAMEDFFVAAQKKQIEILPAHIDVLLEGNDIFARLSKIEQNEMAEWLEKNKQTIHQLLPEIAGFLNENKSILKTAEKKKKKENKVESVKEFKTSFERDKVLRITAQNLNRLMGLAGEALVESRWFSPFEENLSDIKKEIRNIQATVDSLRENLHGSNFNDKAQHNLLKLQHQLHDIYFLMNDRVGELDQFVRNHATLSDRLYQEVINSRMRPFADGVEGFPRMVRDLARELGKEVHLEIEGKNTLVDRDILEKLESPISHLLRNAVAHGIESPIERENVGKSKEGTVILEARQVRGMLSITVSDDGKGIDVEQIRQKIIDKGFLSLEAAKQLNDAEIVDYLFLPSFSTSKAVSQLSGRGVGLNIVQTAVEEMGGTVRAVFVPGKGSSFHLHLPLTLSVIRALLVEIGGQSFAFPLSRIDKAFILDKKEIEMIENRQFFHHEGKNIGLVPAWDILELSETDIKFPEISVVVVSDRKNSYGLVVDRMLGEKELVLHELDQRLGKIQDISAGALMEDGSPILVIDVEEIVGSIDLLVSGGQLKKLKEIVASSEQKIKKRILVVDDSITVRELECRLLENKGYEVEMAVNGLEGWNAVRLGQYDLVISDIDMPRMNGIELLKSIRNDPKTKHLPFMIVSYKSSEDDRLKGLEAGADYYFTKSSFQDTSLIDAVHDLIGNP